MDDLLNYIDKLKTTELGMNRIRRNLGLDDSSNPVSWYDGHVINLG